MPFSLVSEVLCLHQCCAARGQKSCLPSPLSGRLWGMSCDAWEPDTVHASPHKLSQGHLALLWLHAEGSLEAAQRSLKSGTEQSSWAKVWSVVFRQSNYPGICLCQSSIIATLLRASSLTLPLCAAGRRAMNNWNPLHTMSLDICIWGCNYRKLD